MNTTIEEIVSAGIPISCSERVLSAYTWLDQNYFNMKEVYDPDIGRPDIYIDASPSINEFALMNGAGGVSKEFNIRQRLIELKDVDICLEFHDLKSKIDWVRDPIRGGWIMN